MTPPLKGTSHDAAPYDSEMNKEPDSPTPSATPPRRRPRPRLLVGLILLGPLILALAVGVPVGLAASRASRLKNNRASASNGPTANNTNGRNNFNGPITGGDGSAVTLEDGSTFTYSNPFGGFCEYFLPSRNRSSIAF